MTTTLKSSRLVGLDLARLVAFLGMVIVNFKAVMSAEFDTGQFSDLLFGRAAATFVVLAGIGLGLAALKNLSKTRRVTLRRAAFLFVLGLVNMTIFEADILHFYAIYFLFAAALLTVSNRGLLFCIVGLNLLFMVLLFLFDYEAGWDWSTFSYDGIWTLSGFLTNLFFNGWHPVVPWLAFMLFGLYLSRLVLGTRRTQLRLLGFGILAYACAEMFSRALTSLAFDQDLAALFSTAPTPPVPLYVLAGIGAASTVTALCLLMSDWLERIGVLQRLVPAGRQTLTLYMAHIILGMGTLELLGWIENQPESVVLLYSLGFCVVAIIYANLWSRKFARGPLEAIMRRLAG